MMHPFKLQLPALFWCAAVLTCAGSLSGLVVSAQEPGAVAQADKPAVSDSGLQVMLAMESAVTAAIERAEKSVVSLARVNFEQPGIAVNELQPGIGFRPALAPFSIREPASADDPDFIPSEYATGVVIDAKGLVLTNYHVLFPSSAANAGKKYRYYITTSQQKVFEMEVVGSDPRSDLAVMKVKEGVVVRPTDFVPVVFGDASLLRKGQFVIALGNPYAIARDGQVSASWGIISNLSRRAAPEPPDESISLNPRKDTVHHFGTLIQTDARLNLGTSGGALVNLQGEMIGLTTSLAAIAGYEQSAGYAIPTDKFFREAVDKLRQGREVEYGYLGVNPTNLDPVERAIGLRGVRLSAVIAGAPAWRAQLQPGDVVTHVDGHEVSTTDELMLRVGTIAAAGVTQLTVQRGEQTLEATVKLAKFPVEKPRVVTQPNPAWRGLHVDFSTAIRRFDPTQPDMGGPDSDSPEVLEPCVLITEVDEGSPAWDAGLRRGMLVKRVAGEMVDTPAEFLARIAAAEANAAGPVELRLMARGAEPTVVEVLAP